MGQIIVKIIYGSTMTASHLKPRRDTYKILAEDINANGVYRENESVAIIGEDFNKDELYELMTDIVFKELHVYFPYDVDQKFHEDIYALIDRYMQASAPQLVDLWPYPREVVPA